MQVLHVLESILAAKSRVWYVESLPVFPHELIQLSESSHSLVLPEATRMLIDQRQKTFDVLVTSVGAVASGSLVMGAWLLGPNEMIRNNNTLILEPNNILSCLH